MTNDRAEKAKRRALDILNRYSADQPRDERGRWDGGDGGEGDDNWKTAVADAAAKHPADRSESERQAVAHAMHITQDGKPPKTETDEWKTFVANAIAKPPSKRSSEEKRAIGEAMRLAKHD